MRTMFLTVCQIGKRNCGGVKCALCIRTFHVSAKTSRAFSGDIQKRWTDANRKDGAGQISTVRNNKKSPASDFLASLSLSL